MPSTSPLHTSAFCPVCEYDLRASTGRCPECGTPIASGRVPSRIPWLHRKQRGRVRAYIRTVGRVFIRPYPLFKQAGSHLRPRDLLGFHRVNTVVAALLVVAMFIGVVKSDLLEHVLGDEHVPYALYPALVLRDRWWAAFVLVPGVFAATALSVAGYRWVMTWGHSTRRVRRSVSALGLVISALAPVAMIVAGIEGLGAILLDDSRASISAFSEIIRMTMYFTAIVSFIWYLIVTACFAFATRKRPLVKIGVLMFYPLLAYAVTLLILFCTLWAAGYIALALRSMTL